MSRGLIASLDECAPGNRTHGFPHRPGWQGEVSGNRLGALLPESPAAPSR